MDADGQRSGDRRGSLASRATRLKAWVGAGIADWVHLVAAPSSYLLVAALAVTVAAKLAVLRGLQHLDAWEPWAAHAIAADGVVLMSLAAALALAEAHRAWLRHVTVPISLAVFAVSSSNAVYLGIAGEQLALQSVATGIARLADVVRILAELLAAVPGETGLAAAVAILGPMWACSRAMRRSGRFDIPASSGRRRARATTGVAGVAFIAWVACAPSPIIPVRLLQHNAFIAMLTAIPSGPDDAGHSLRGDATAAAATTPMAVGSRPNIVVVVIESLRWDVTSLANPAAGMTPALRALAAEGMTVETVRAAVPHTTKSLWIVLCGVWPALAPDAHEATMVTETRCLPHTLSAAGYSTALLQSARGTFEDRPRLAANLGFDEFKAWEDLGGEPLGYLASDDASLGPALAEFIDARRPRPFAAVLLTSSTHHPYRIGTAVGEPRAESVGTDEERYRVLVRRADHLLAEVVAVVAARGLAKNTIVVALGDHGEGFGDQGVRQHDTNFYDEGLRVPWVMAGPGVPRQVVTGSASLLDVHPTMLDALGVPLSPGHGPGASVLDGRAPLGPRPFVCWFPAKCRGYVEGEVKVVSALNAELTFAFDLARDPHERGARPPTEAERGRLAMVDALVRENRPLGPLPALPAIERYPAWRCAALEPCRYEAVQRETPASGTDRLR